MQNSSNSRHNTVDIKIGYNLQKLYFIPYLLDFKGFLMYSIQVNIDL